MGALDCRYYDASNSTSGLQQLFFANLIIYRCPQLPKANTTIQRYSDNTSLVSHWFQ